MRQLCREQGTNQAETEEYIHSEPFQFQWRFPALQLGVTRAEVMAAVSLDMKAIVTSEAEAEDSSDSDPDTEAEIKVMTETNPRYRWDKWWLW